MELREFHFNRFIISKVCNVNSKLKGCLLAGLVLTTVVGPTPSYAARNVVCGEITTAFKAMKWYLSVTNKLAQRQMKIRANYLKKLPSNVNGIRKSFLRGPQDAVARTTCAHSQEAYRLQAEYSLNRSQEQMEKELARINKQAERRFKTINADRVNLIKRGVKDVLVNGDGLDENPLVQGVSQDVKSCLEKPKQQFDKAVRKFKGAVKDRVEDFIDGAIDGVACAIGIGSCPTGPEAPLPDPCGANMTIAGASGPNFFLEFLSDVFPPN